MTPNEIMCDLARHDIFPRPAMAAARSNRETMAPAFVALIERLATQPIASMRDQDVDALIPVFHLLGEWQETRAYRPLVQLMRRPTETIDYLLGDAITETGFRVVAATFDGDLQPIFEAVEDPGADDFARSAMMCALVLIAQRNPELRPEIETFFREFLEDCDNPGPDLLIGWMDAIADLGLEDMTGAVRALFDVGLIPADYCDFSHFLGDLQATVAAGGVPANRRYRQSLITDAIEELSKWHCYSDAFLAEPKPRKVSRDFAPWSEALANVIPKLGRNDPCSCGSGKKFKKCCLH